MKVIQRIVVAIAVFFALVLLLLGYPVFAPYFIITGKDATGWTTKIFRGRL